MTIGILPLGRATFDIAFAEEKLAAMLTRLEATGAELAGPRSLLLDAEAARMALSGLVAAGVERLLLLQVTFTDAMIAMEAAGTGIPLSIWAVPEPRLGGRLRLNAFCGLNLASHAVSRTGRECNLAWAYADAGEITSGDLAGLLDGSGAPGRLEAAESGAGTAAGREIAGRISGRRIARIGARPDGFETCAYDPLSLKKNCNIDVEEIDLNNLFDIASDIPEAAAGALLKRAEAELAGLGELDPAELDRSLRLKAALDRLRVSGGYDAFAIRCWPETFTEYGGAVCGPVSMMGEERVPCACEADVYGALTQMLLQEVAGAPVFLTDLVDVDKDDDSAVIWHCGQAPVSMRAPGAAATATIHTNRRMPLLYQFALKPGRVTLVRISRAFGKEKMILAGAEMLERPMAFTGTSGVLRFERPAGEVLPDIIASGLEHHMAVAYGEHRPLLREAAAAMGLGVLEL